MSESVLEALAALHNACMYRDAAVATGVADDSKQFALSQYVGAMQKARRALSDAATQGVNADGK